MLLKKLNNMELFETVDQIPPKVNLEGLTTIEFFIPGEPVPKQSVRGSINRWRSDGTHASPLNSNVIMNHKKGDAIIFKNQSTGNIDCQIMFYPDSKLEKIKKGYQQVFQAIMNTMHVPMFSEECHILKLYFVFPFLSVHSEKFKKKCILGDSCAFKTTKPDMPDNLKKLVLDSMSGIVFKDDSLICSEQEVMKYYGPKSGTFIQIAGK